MSCVCMIVLSGCRFLSHRAFLKTLHVHTHIHTFAAAGDSFLIFHSNSCGLALILPTETDLKDCLTLRVCMYIVCLAVWDVIIVSLVGLSVVSGMTGHDMSETDRLQILAGHTILKYNTQQGDDEDEELSEESITFYYTLILITF